MIRDALRNIPRRRAAAGLPPSRAEERRFALDMLRDVARDNPAGLDEMNLETCTAAAQRIIDEELPAEPEAAP